MSVAPDTLAPDFTAPATSDATFVLSAQRGKNVVLYFYPKDSTPGCTTESLQFRDHEPAFAAANAIIVGISRDSIRSHENFKGKLELPFGLVSDADEAVCLLYDVMKNKKMYGRDVRGIERSTFVIDAEGVVRNVWRGVKVPNHVEEVLAAVQAL
jgi:peroxiredoxin Q/BCP